MPGVAAQLENAIAQLRESKGHGGAKKDGGGGGAWRNFPADRVAVSEKMKLAAQIKDGSWSLSTTGEQLTNGKHFWEVEICSTTSGGPVANVFVGVCKPDVAPDVFLGTRESTEGWFVGTYRSGFRHLVGALFGNGRMGEGRVGSFAQGNEVGFENGDRVGVLLDLDDGSLRFFKNGVEHGPGYPAGSVTGPVARAAQMLDGGDTVRLLPDATWPAGHVP